MFILRLTVFALVSLAIVSTSIAEDDYSIHTDPVTKARYFNFKSPKGDVRFNHDLHQMLMKTDECIPCHKTKTPTKEHKMSRFDQRSAHSFCKGCHKDSGQGPLECHECHKQTKK